MPVDDVLQIKPNCRLTNQLGLNILHYRVATVVGAEPTYQETADAISTTFAPAYKALLTSQASYQGLGVQRVRPGPLSLEAFSTNGFGPGGGGGDPLPSQVAGILTKQTNLAGRKFRGRVYVPFPSEQENTGAGVPNLAYVTNLIILAAILVATQTVTGVAGTFTLQPVIFHRVGVPAVTLITAVRPNPVWATQRRRGAYGSLNFPA
jgi:hypothetical protein